MDIHLHIGKLVIDLPAEKIDKILEIVIDNNLKLKTMANELDNLTTEVAETKTVIGSAIVLLKGLKDKLDAAGTDPAKLAALSAELDNSQTELAAAITANSPAEEGGV